MPVLQHALGRAGSSRSSRKEVERGRQIRMFSGRHFPALGFCSSSIGEHPSEGHGIWPDPEVLDLVKFPWHLIDSP